MNSIILDTHAWIWYVNGNAELSKLARKKINEAINNNRAYLAAISLWEIAMLELKGRITLEMPYFEWINQSIKLTKIHISPLTPAIAAESRHLPGTFHGDPADKMIVATARCENHMLITRDSKILDYSRDKYISIIKA
jgi:PIN domain nuclease of toxin-antitoxin system